MPGVNELRQQLAHAEAQLREEVASVQAKGHPADIVRREQLRKLSELTGRNTILYYSGFLQKNVDNPRLNQQAFSITDFDMNGFMATVKGMDTSLGLDLLLHTPGGGITPTEAIVGYLRDKFGTDIRAVVPQLAMSAGTMIACAASEILMGRQSSLGPVDPQLGGLPAHGVIEEFKRAFDEIKADNAKVAVWQPVIAKYSPTFIGQCEKAIKLTNEMVAAWLQSGMFREEGDPAAKAEAVLRELGSHAANLTHDRHLSADKCEALGLKITKLEEDQPMQDAVLSVHHACVLTFSLTNASKIIENNAGTTVVQGLGENH